jgi:heat shock protein HtpX
MYSQIAANKRKTVLIMGLFIVLVGGLAWLFGQFMGDEYITPYVLAGALVYVAISYFASSRVSLAMNGAKQIEKRDNPRLYRIVENLAITEGLPTPKVYIIEDPALNAFATGKDPKHASVAATTGLLDALDDKELQGVMAHELGHVKNYDIRVSMIAFALVAVVGLISDIMLRMTWFRDNDDNSSSGQLFFILGIVAAILAPIAATLIQLAISRKREYLADATGALATRYPEGLASALEKIQANGSVLKRQNSSTAHFFFANPLKKGSISGLFSTHPPIDERVKRLEEMGDKL